MSHLHIPVAYGSHTTMKKKINDGLTAWERHRLKDIEAYRKRKREYARTPIEREKRRLYLRQWYRNGGGERQGHVKRGSSKPFDEKILKVEGGCWEWQGGKDRDGYGRYGNKRAHRITYERVNGKIPEGLVIDHLCCNKGCVNPNHLEVVSPSQNSKRNYERGMVSFLKTYHLSKTHCPQGHPYSGENLRLSKIKGRKTRARRCKICDAEKTKRYLMRKKIEKERAAILESGIW